MKLILKPKAKILVIDGEEYHYKGIIMCKDTPPFFYSGFG